MSLDLNQKLALHAPYCYLHSKEDCYPADINSFFIPKVSIKDKKGNTLAGSSSQPLTASDMAKYGNASNYLSDHDDTTTRAGEEPTSSYTPPCYAHICEFMTPWGETRYDLQYWLFYPYNGKVDGLGDHVGDWEKVAVRIDVNGAVLGIYYSKHDHVHDQWFGVADIDWHQQQPIVYVAYHSHANYRKAGNQDRGALPDDKTDKGVLWDCAQSICYLGKSSYANDGKDPVFDYTGVDDTTKQWIQFDGRWGQMDSSLPIHGNSPKSPWMRGEYSEGIKQGAGVFRLKFSEQVLKDILRAGYKQVSIRVTCREDNLIPEYSHNNTNLVALVSGQTEYLLTCKRCKIADFASASEYAYPYQYELRLTNSKGETWSPNGRKNLHDADGKKYNSSTALNHYDGYIVITELQINNSRIEESNL